MRSLVLATAATMLAGCGEVAAPSQVAASVTVRDPPKVSTASTAVTPPPAPAPKTWPHRVLVWDFPTSAIGKTRVVVVSPETTERLPVLVALHGLGEAHKGFERGARGWLDDYGLVTAIERLKAPPLTLIDMQQLGSADHLAAVNLELEKHPYRGLIVVCPFTPDILGSERSLDAAIPLGRHIVEEVLPRVRAETPALSGREATGIDGVSLGGRASLLVGLAHPEHFGVVGSLQAAVYEPDLPVLTQRVQAMRSRFPNTHLRLLTSSHDFYRSTITRWSKSLTTAGVAHQLDVVDRGPHSYAFNRGLGVFAMLTYHDRALR